MPAKSIRAQEVRSFKNRTLAVAAANAHAAGRSSAVWGWKLADGTEVLRISGRVLVAPTATSKALERRNVPSDVPLSEIVRSLRAGARKKR